MGRNSTANTGKCKCDKENFQVVGYEGRFKDTYVIQCKKCYAQWLSKAKYCKELPKASWVK